MIVRSTRPLRFLLKTELRLHKCSPQTGDNPRDLLHCSAQNSIICFFCFGIFLVFGARTSLRFHESTALSALFTKLAFYFFYAASCNFLWPTSALAIASYLPCPPRQGEGREVFPHRRATRILIQDQKTFSRLQIS